MITEIVGAMGCLTGIMVLRNLRDRDINRIKLLWQLALQKCNTQGIKNKDGDTFDIDKISREGYGYSLVVPVPLGLSAETLYKAKDILQDNLKCLIEFDKEKFKDYVKVKLIAKDFKTQEFKPVKTKTYQLYLGRQIDGEECFLDLRADPHLLIAGKTRFGKSFLFASLLTNLIYNNSNDFEIFLLQIMKGEIDVYKKCKPVKFISNSEEEIKIILDKICKKINQRSKLFASHGIKNIEHWNKHYPKNKMKRMLICAEEISFFTNDNDSDIFKSFTAIVKAGAAAGVHFIGITQRTTIANLPSELKSQMAVASTKQRSSLDSINAIDITDAVNLKKQEFIVACNDGYIFFKVPTIDEDFKILNKYVPEIIIPDIHDKPIAAEKQQSNCIDKPIDVSDYKNLTLNRRIKDNLKKGIKTTVIDLSQKKKNNTICLNNVIGTHNIKPNVDKPKKAVILLEDLKNASNEG